MEWLTAEEALSVLQTKPQTLYANVSRGRIRAKPSPDDPRRSLYRAEDVRRLAERRPGRKRESAIAAETIRWGAPIMRSAISTIIDGRLLYRGCDAAELSQQATLEETAALLWQMETGQMGQLPRAGQEPDDAAAKSPLERLFIVFGRRAANDLPTSGRSPAVLQREAFGLLRLFYGTVLGDDAPGLPLHQRIALNWQRPDASDIIRRTLVLLADHELNASSFATRVAASTGAPLSAAVLAGLAALIGPRHGRASLSTAALIAAAREKDAAIAIRERLLEGSPLHSFGHPMYREAGDARAAALLARIELPPLYRALEAAAADLLGEKPNIDFALAAIAEIYDLPEDAPLLFFALGRIVGWLAHALEQVENGSLIRPRAEFIAQPG
ncbi:citrate synthase [Phyllobacteriaceae bacterium JZ32]